MYSHILIPVAFEPGHDHQMPLDVAKKLADKGGKVTLLHVMDPIPAYALSYMPEGFRDESKEAIFKELEQRAKGWDNVETRITEGSPGPAICDFAETHDVDLIVIASHRPGVKDYFLGSTAARVVRHAKCNVHVMR